MVNTVDSSGAGGDNPSCMSLFYEMVGSLLAQSAERLASDDANQADRDSVDSGRELRQIPVLLSRIGAMWPRLIPSLSGEIRVLSAALAELAEHLRTWNVEVSDADDDIVNEDEGDLLGRYQTLMGRLEKVMMLLHSRRDESWAADGLGIARRGLAKAAAIQGEIVDLALSTPRPQS